MRGCAANGNQQIEPSRFQAIASPEPRDGYSVPRMPRATSLAGRVSSFPQELKAATRHEGTTTRATMARQATRHRYAAGDLPFIPGDASDVMNMPRFSHSWLFVHAGKLRLNKNIHARKHHALTSSSAY
jgi:hypothetical protein